MERDAEPKENSLPFYARGGWISILDSFPLEYQIRSRTALSFSLSRFDSPNIDIRFVFVGNGNETRLFANSTKPLPVGYIISAI